MPSKSGLRDDGEVGSSFSTPLQGKALQDCLEPIADAPYYASEITFVARLWSSAARGGNVDRIV